ncbi:MAG: hypothetical protein K2L73_02305, partial [Muribaculaceae bacterium]|nr:hypothetical protein [Muribaculaceae bacterium]
RPPPALRSDAASAFQRSGICEGGKRADGSKTEELRRMHGNEANAYTAVICKMVRCRHWRPLCSDGAVFGSLGS